jgi:proteasome beta subunit
MTTIVGIKTKEGVVLASDKRASKGFFIASKDAKKIYQIDTRTAAAIAGQVSDAEYLVNLVRAQKKLMQLERGFELSVFEITKLISNAAYYGLRSYAPFLAEFIVAGVDSEPRIYSTDVSGAISPEVFTSSGSGSPIAYGVLESSYNDSLTLDEAKNIADKAVRAAMQRDPGSGDGVEIITIPLGGGQA